MLVRLSDEAPLHLQVYRAFREAILSGKIAPGSRLPSSRAEARTLGVSRNVVLQAYGQLEAEGYIGGAQGSGTYVTSEIPEAPAPLKGAVAASGSPIPLSDYARRASHTMLTGRRRLLPYDFAYGLSRPDEVAVRSWQRALRRASEKLSLDYGPPEGDPDLREAIAHYLFRNRAVRTSAEHLVVVSGSQQGLSLVSRLLFEPGDRLLLEDPCYQGARQIFRADGLELIPCPVREDGLEWPRAADAKAVYVTPSHQFPTGVTLPLAKRLKLLSWAQERNAVILEDDYDSEYRYVSRPLGALQGMDAHERVVYIGTFSKVLFPAVRVGYLVVPPSLWQRFVDAREAFDLFSPTLYQLALAEFLREGHFARHLRRMRGVYMARRDALLTGLARHCRDRLTVHNTDAGLHVAVLLSGGLDDRDVVRRMAGRGLTATALSSCYAEPARRSGLLLGFGGSTERRLLEATRVLAEVLGD